MKKIFSLVVALVFACPYPSLAALEPQQFVKEIIEMVPPDTATVGILMRINDDNTYNLISQDLTRGLGDLSRRGPWHGDTELRISLNQYQLMMLRSADKDASIILEVVYNDPVTPQITYAQLRLYALKIIKGPGYEFFALNRTRFFNLIDAGCPRYLLDN